MILWTWERYTFCVCSYVFSGITPIMIHCTCSFSRKIQPNICIYTSYTWHMPLNLEGFFPSHLPFMAGHCTVAATTQGLLWDPGRVCEKKQIPGLKHRENPAGDHICCLFKETVILWYIYIYRYIYISYNYNMAHYGSKIYWCPKKWIYI